MDLVTTVQQDLIKALKTKDEVTLRTLRTLKSALQKVSIDAHGEITEAQALAVVKSEIKKRQDSITAYRAGGREDLAASEAAELAVLQRYQPAQLSAEALQQKIKDLVAQSPTKDFGPLMGRVMKELNGAADGQQVQAVLKQILQQQ